MTSTNDGKEVKSNQTSGQKGKTYFIELYKSLEARLSSECVGEQRTRLVCEAWRRVHSLCQHSAPTTHPHLRLWLQRHTAHTILQTEWQSPKSKEQHIWLEEAIDTFIWECKEAASKRDSTPPWESQLLERAHWFRGVLSNPWGHPVLKALLDSRGPQPTDDEVIAWLKEERSVVFVTRLRQLAAAKCDDLALLLATTVMSRARACTPSTSDVEQAEDRSDQLEPPQGEPTFQSILSNEAGFTVDVWELLTDLEFVLLYKGESRSRCIELAKQTPLRNGYQLAERLQSRLEMSPRDKKLWKNAKEVATLIAQVVIARCMVVPVCGGLCRKALYGCARSLARAARADRLRAAAAALAAPAATARHLHTLAAAVHAQCKEERKSFVCELYVRAITAGMNELERLKIKTEKESEARTSEQTLSTWFLQLGALLADSSRLSHECVLTAFSVHPSPVMYERVKTAPSFAPTHKDQQDSSPETMSEFGSWATDSRTQTNLVKTSETLNLKQTQKQANVLSTAIFAEGEALGLGAELCQDLAVLISGPRVKTLSWDMDRELLLENCRAYMDRTHGGTRALTTELKYLNLDLRSYQHLPEEADDENDMFYGIEKGYEHLVEFQEPEEIWEDAPSDSDKSFSSMESTVPRRKKKNKCIKYSSEEETDPLSLGELKTIMKKERHNSKEPSSKERNSSNDRPHSKERLHSKERKKKKDKSKTEDNSTKDITTESATDDKSKDMLKKEKKKERKERKKKEKSEKRVPEIQKQVHTSALSRLIGMKVARIPDINIPNKNEHTNINNVCITDSDYDSQGKSSITSLNSEGNDPDVLFDGLFSMDEIKSPERTTDSVIKATTARFDELKVTNGMIVNSPKIHNRTKVIVHHDSSFIHAGKGDVRDEAKKSTKKLIEFRRNRPNEDLAKQESLTNNNQLFAQSKKLSSNENTYPYRPITAESVITSNAPKIYLNEDNVKRLTSLKDEVNNILKNCGTKGNTFEKMLNKKNNDVTHVKVSGKIPGPVCKNVNKNYKQSVKNVAHSNQFDQNFQLKPIYQRSETPSQEQYKEFLKQRNLSATANNTHINHMIESPNENRVQNIYREQQQIDNTKTSFHQINIMCHEKMQQDAQQVIPNHLQSANVKHLTFSQEARAQRLSASKNLQSIPRKTISNPSSCSGQNQFQDFLKELQETINAGATKDINDIKPSTTDKNPCAKQTVQQKKVDDAPKTFSRLSYMHKNKQCDIKNKVDQNSLQNMSPTDTQNLGGYFDKVHHLQPRGDIEVSRLDKTKNPNKMLSNSKVIVQKVQNFKCLPSTKNTPLCLNRQYPLISQALRTQSPNFSNKISQEIENKIIEQKNEAPSSGFLTEQDQNELLLLLRQQSRMNPFKSLQKTEIHNPIDRTSVVNLDLQQPGANMQLNVNLQPNINTQQPNVQIQPNINLQLVNKPKSNFTQKPSVNLQQNVKVQSDVNLQQNAKIQININTQPNMKSDKIFPIDIKLVKKGKTIRETTSPPMDLSSSSVKQPKDKSSNSGSALKKVRNVKNRGGSSKQSPKSKEKSDWESVMNALLAHKTPSRGPNALDIVLKKDSFEKRSANNKAGTENAKGNLNTKNKDVPAGDHEKLKSLLIHTSKPNQCSTNAVVVKTMSMDLNQKPDKRLNYQDKNVEKASKTPLASFNDKNLTDIIDEDPFISGIQNSDYDLLEELMDDELRKEIGELSDEEAYGVLTTSPKARKDTNTFVNKFPNYKINPMSMPKPQEPCQNLGMPLAESVTFSQKQIPDLQQNCSAIQKSVLNSGSNTCIPIKNITKTKPRIISNELITSTPLNQPSNHENSNHQLGHTINKQNTEINRKRKTFLNINAAPDVEKGPGIKNNLMDPARIVLTVPQRKATPNVVVIGNDVIYDRFSTIQINQPTMNENAINYNNIAVNQAPNLTLFSRKPQLSAPCVTPIVINNSITLPVLQKVSPNVRTNLVSNSSTINTELSSNYQNIFGDLLLQSQEPNAETVQSSSLPTHTENKINSIEVSNCYDNSYVNSNIAKDANFSETIQNAQNFCTSISNFDPMSVTNQGVQIIKDTAKNIQQKRIGSRTKHDMETEKKLALFQSQKREKILSKVFFDSPNEKKPEVATEVGSKTEDISDKDRIELKRKRILNRQIYHRCFAETIALPYEPIKAVKKRNRTKTLPSNHNRKTKKCTKERDKSIVDVKNLDDEGKKVTNITSPLMNQKRDTNQKAYLDSSLRKTNAGVAKKSKKDIVKNVPSSIINQQSDILTEEDSNKVKPLLDNDVTKKDNTSSQLRQNALNLNSSKTNTVVNKTDVIKNEDKRVQINKDIEEQIMPSVITNNLKEAINYPPSNENEGLETITSLNQNNIKSLNCADSIIVDECLNSNGSVHLKNNQNECTSNSEENIKKLQNKTNTTDFAPTDKDLRESSNTNENNIELNKQINHSLEHSVINSKDTESNEQNKIPLKKTTNIPSNIFKYKDNIIFEELPNSNNDPLKKCVRIKLPNGTTFKATISGKLNVNVDSIFEDPTIKALLWKNMNNNTKCTLNIKQVAMKTPTKSHTVMTQVYDITYPTPIVINNTETIDLISDDEDNTQTFKTEFGKFNTPCMDYKLFSKHQERLSQKCIVKIDTLLSSETGVAKLETTSDKKDVNFVNPTLVKEKILDVIEIDDSSNEVPNIDQTKLIDDVEDLKSEVLENNPQQVKDNNCKSVQEHFEKLLDENITSSKLGFNKKEPRECHLKIQKCDDLIEKIRIKKRPCFVNLVRCDDILKKYQEKTNVISNTTQISHPYQNDSTDLVIMTNSSRRTLKRSESLSILTDFSLSAENTLPKKSPTMIENFEILHLLSESKSICTNNLDYKSTKIHICNADWLMTKSIMRGCHDDLEAYKTISKIENGKLTYDDSSTDCESDIESQYQKKLNDKCEVNIVQYQVPSFLKLVINYFECNSELINILKPIKRKIVTSMGPLKRKTSGNIDSASPQKITKKHNTSSYYNTVDETDRIKVQEVISFNQKSTASCETVTLEPLQLTNQEQFENSMEAIPKKNITLIFEKSQSSLTSLNVKSINEISVNYVNSIIDKHQDKNYTTGDEITITNNSVSSSEITSCNANDNVDLLTQKKQVFDANSSYISKNLLKVEEKMADEITKIEKFVSLTSSDNNLDLNVKDNETETVGCEGKSHENNLQYEPKSTKNVFDNEENEINNINETGVHDIKGMDSEQSAIKRFSININDCSYVTKKQISEINDKNNKNQRFSEISDSNVESEETAQIIEKDGKIKKSSLVILDSNTKFDHLHETNLISALYTDDDDEVNMPSNDMAVDCKALKTCCPKSAEISIDCSKSEGSKSPKLTEVVLKYRHAQNEKKLNTHCHGSSTFSTSETSPKAHNPSEDMVKSYDKKKIKRENFNKVDENIPNERNSSESPNVAVQNNNNDTCNEEEMHVNLNNPFNEHDYVKSVTNIRPNDNTSQKNVTLVYSNESNVVLNGSIYEDPIVGTCYLFPILNRTALSNEISFNNVSDESNNDVIKTRIFDDRQDEEDNSNNLNVVIPKITYSRPKFKETSKFVIENRKNLKRKSDTTDNKFNEKRYRKGKNIDYPKITISAISESAYSKEYKRLFNYCSSIKFSFSRTFHKEYIDVNRFLKGWPIQDSNINITDLAEYENDLFTDSSLEQQKLHDPLQQTLAQEISSKYLDNQSSRDQINESNFSMGFGEGSDRVIQNSEDENNISKFSAATLSDVKQSQPFLLSEDYESYDKNIEINKCSKYHNEVSHRFMTIIQQRDKIRSFFEKTCLELHYDRLKNYGDKIDKSDTIFPYDLACPDFIEPVPIETVVQVVQLGQLPVSATTQNHVTCDPRVTQVTDVNPSQCLVENSNRDDSQSPIKTEYTELTTADLTLPLMQQYERHMKSKESTTVTISNENITVEMEVTQIKTEEEVVIKEEPLDYNDDEFQAHLAHSQINNVEYSYICRESNPCNESEQNTEVIYETYRNENSETIQNSEYTSDEKTNQIAHAMNAAGINSKHESNIKSNTSNNSVTMPQENCPHISSSSPESNTNAKPSKITVMALQQALAQALPSPVDQINIQENNPVANSSVTPQVLHIVQSKNSNGNQITLVENSSNVSGNSSAPVLHIVQSKGGNNSISNANNNSADQNNSFNGLSLVDAGLQQGNNQLLHIVNTGTQKNCSTTGQLLKRVNLLTSVSNSQGSNEQKMVQFVCKSADGKSIHLNAPHQRGMVLRLQPIESPNVQINQETTEEQNSTSPSSNANVTCSKEINAQHEIKSRSVYEENYAKFIQSSSNHKPMPEKATSLPKFNQAFGKQVFQDNSQKNNEMDTTTNLSSEHVDLNLENSDCQPTDSNINLDHIPRMSSPPLLVRKPSISNTQSTSIHPNSMQQNKQNITPMNIQTMHGGVIYTRQIPVNIGGGQTINLITVPSTDLIEEANQKHHNNLKFVNQGEIEPPIIKIVPQLQTTTEGCENVNHTSTSNDSSQNTPSHPPPMLTQMRIKLPMLSKAPQVVSGNRVVRPSFFQIQRNVIGGANQQVYQQLVLTAAPPLGQHIRLPQGQPTRNVNKATSESQSSPESQMSTSTLEQLREFDMVLEQVKERSTVQPSASLSPTNTYKKVQSSEAIDSTSVTSTVTESTKQVLYSVASNQSVNVAYVSRKPSQTATTPTQSFARSPDSSGIIDSPSSTSTISTHAQIPHTPTSESTPSEASTSQTSQPKTPKASKSKSRPKSSHTPNSVKVNSVPPKTSSQKPLEDEQTTQRILYILAEYKEQVENSPDKDKPAPRRRTNPPINPGSSKRKKSSSGSRRPGREMSPVHCDDTCRTMGSEDSSCGASQGECESCMESQSPQGSPRKAVRKLNFENETTQPRPQPHRNVIVADGQTITVARGTSGKPTTAVLMPANYILPVSMVKSGQQIAIVTNRGPKLITVGGEGGTNAVLLQRLIGPAGLKPVLARPGVRQVRLPAAALHNLQAFNLAAATTVQPPDSTVTPATVPTPPDLIDCRAARSPWPERESQDVKPEPESSPEASEPWNLATSSDPNDYLYEETVRTDNNMNRTVLDAIPDRYSPEMEAQRIFDKMFDVDSKKSYTVDSQDDSPRCEYDIDTSDGDDKPYRQVVQRKAGGAHRTRLTHVSAAALRHKYAILEHELRLQGTAFLQKSLSEECEDLGVDSPSASELFPEAELLFSNSPAHDVQQHSQTPQPAQPQPPQPDMDDQIATDQLLDEQNLGVTLGLDEAEDMQITLDHEEFARSHPNTTFHSEPTDDGEIIQPFTITGLKGRHITSTIFHAGRAPATVLVSAPQTTVISQATPENGVQHVKYANINHIISSSSHANLNLPSVVVKDRLTKFDGILNDSRELHLSNTASAVIHSTGNATQVIRRVCYEDDRRDARFLLDEPEGLIAGDDAKMIAEDSRDATLESMPDDGNSSPERHTELFWESNSASERSESRRPLDFSSDSDKCCKSPCYEENNSTDSSIGTHMRLDSVIKDARGLDRSGSADGSSDDTHPPLRTYPAKRVIQGDAERSLSGKTRAVYPDERTTEQDEGRRRASNRGVVKRGCHCCSGSPIPPRPKKPRQRKPNLDFNHH